MSGLCECGCGQRTAIARQNRPSRGHVKGQPVRFARGHNQRRGPAASCDPATLVGQCRDCGVHMHRMRSHVCSAGHLRCAGRQLCAGCWGRRTRNGTLADVPRATRSRDEVLDEWVFLRPEGITSRQFAERMGMSLAAWERMFYRALAAGDPRAVRPVTGRLAG